MTAHRQACTETLLKQGRTSGCLRVVLIRNPPCTHPQPILYSSATHPALIRNPPCAHPQPTLRNLLHQLPLLQLGLASHGQSVALGQLTVRGGARVMDVTNRLHAERCLFLLFVIIWAFVVLRAHISRGCAVANRVCRSNDAQANLPSGPGLLSRQHTEDL